MVKSQSAGIVARAKTALKAEPKSETKTTTADASRKPSSTSATVETPRKPSASTTAATTTNVASKTSKTSVVHATAAARSVKPEVEKLPIASPVDKKVSQELPDESNNRTKRNALSRPPQPSTPTTASTTSSLVAARKKQLHEQQAKSSPINAASSVKKFSVKSGEKKASGSASLTDRVVKSSTEKLDVDRRVTRQATTPTSTTSKKSSSTSVPSNDRQVVVKASTEKFDGKRASVKPFEEVQKGKISTNEPQKEEKLAKKILTKKSSSINVVLAAAQRKESREVENVEKTSKNVEKISKNVESVDVVAKKNPLLSAVIDDHQACEVSGSAENLSTRVNLSSASSVTSEQELLGAKEDKEDQQSDPGCSPIVSSDNDDDDMTSKPPMNINIEAIKPPPSNRHLSNVTRVKRSESDGIVVAERPKSDKPPVRRCESTDDATRLVDEMGVSEAAAIAKANNSGLNFPSSIKTVASATIVQGPEDANLAIGQAVHFRAHYFGNPEPRVIWLKNGVRVIPSEEGGRISIKTYSGESTLLVRDLRGEDSGKYEIVIENEVGNDAAVASLGVEGPPDPPASRPFVGHIDASSKSLTLAWYGSSFDGGSIVTGYIVEMSSWPITDDSRPPEATDWTVLTNCHHSTSFVVKGLSLDREYIFRVKAANVHGESEPSRVSEPVSFSSHGSANEDDDDSVHHAKKDHDKHDKSRDGGDDESGEEEDLEHDHSFNAPFEHRNVELKEGSIFKSKYEIYEELGRGRFGVVFKVKDKENGEVLAAKFVRCRKSEERQKVKDEVAIMNVLDHSKLLQLAAAYENQREMIMVMEYIGGGELFEKVVADDFTLTERDCVLFMRQICDAVGYMHEHSIVHLDLKPENILCKSKSSHLIKIIDFGLARKLKKGEDVRILFGTPEFVSPEVISYEPVSTTSDMWSVGVVCYVLLSGLSPFMGDSDVETFANISGIAYDFDDEAFDNIGEEAKDFIRKLLVKHQNKRMTASQCLEHVWLKLTPQSSRNFKEINTDKLKSFLMRRRWQKAAHAIRALGRFTSLGFRADAKDSASSITALSTQSADF